MNKTIWKNTFREIKSSLSRYLSIFAITALGVGFFAGITASPYSMRYSADNYYERLNLADFRLVSIFGFDQDDVQSIKELNFDKIIYPAYYCDMFLHRGEQEDTVRVMSLPDGNDFPLNKIEIVAGRLPENPNECIVDMRWYSPDRDTIIGETITLSHGSKDGDVYDVLANDTYTIVGIIRTVLFPSDDTRGHTNIGAGVISYAVFIPEVNFTLDKYTEIFVLFDELREYLSYTDDYTNAAELIEEHLDELGKQRIAGHVDDIIEEAYDELNKAEQELADAKKEVEEELNDAKRELDEGKQELDKAKELLDEAWIEIEQGWEALYKAQAEYSSEIRNGEWELIFNREEMVQAELEYEAAVMMFGEEMLFQTRMELDYGWAMLLQGEEALEAARVEGRRELDNASALLDEPMTELKEGILEYEQGLADYEQGLLDYAEGEREAREKLAEADEEIAQAHADLAKLIDDLNDLPGWFIFNRDGFPGYSEYGENADRVASIARAFPLFFLIVAALVCSTTVSRMVEENRVQVGLFKALGYSSSTIIFKYMFYAVSAAVLGSIFGILVGMKLFPYVILYAYQMMYNIPDMLMPYDLRLAIISLTASGGLIAAVVYISIRKELSERPAQLMRPKAPKKGKRVFLEKIGFVWNRLSFSSKVTVRNIFRYKRRMLMTVIGIAGCTALMLTGFALRNSVGDIAELQFKKIILNDGWTYIDHEMNNEDKARLEAVFSEYGGELIYAMEKMMVCEKDNQHIKFIMAVVKDEQADKFGEYFTFTNRLTGEEYSLNENGAIITEKLAKLLDIDVGGEAVISRSETEKVRVIIGGITENYTMHYIRMTESKYYELFGEMPEYGVAFFNGVAVEDNDELAARLLNEELVFGTVFMSDFAGGFDDMINMLNLVIIILVSAAGTLSLIVLYNLTNINICERIREIATLKVLGFYDVEVDMYIFRENALLTLMGTGFGLFGGIYLSRFIIQTAEVNDVMFGREIHPLSFILAALVTIAFSTMVSAFMHFYLKKVNMAESLKSID
ncbi:MAG: hypothetical protein FWD34_03065 [Oscillospiraceae bacterium]|nr:hypothetical protein [Oscillospiraceae bacterium]